MKFKAAPDTEVNGCDQAGNAWPEPLRFGKKGELVVPDDQQDVVAALEGAVAAGIVKRVSARTVEPDGNKEA